MLLAILGFASGLKAQLLSIRDSENLEPMEMVSVFSQSPAIELLSDTRGQVDITSLKGVTNIEIRLLGFKSVKTSYQQLEAQDFKVYMEELMLNLDQVVVSASRWTHRKKNIPAKVSSIGSKEIALQNPQTAADMLSNSSEVFIQKSQLGGGSPMIRGFSTNRLLIAVDGIRMNTAIFRSGNLQNVISIDPFSVERAEILFGPSSVNYGSDAIGGVMSFQTMSPELSPDDKILVKGGSTLRFSSAGNEQTAHLHVGVGWEKWGLLSSFTHSDFGDLRMGSYGPDEYLSPFYVSRIDSLDRVMQNKDPEVQVPTAYSQTSMMHKLRFKPSSEWTFDLGMIYSATTSYSRYDRLIRTSDNGLPRSAAWEYGPQIWLMNTLSINHKHSTALYDELGIKMAYQFFEESRYDRDFNDPIENERIEYVDAYSLNIDLKKQLSDKHAIFYGAEYILNVVESKGYSLDVTNGSLSKASPRYPNADWNSYAVFASYQYTPSDKLTVLAGARYNAFSLEAEFDTSLFQLPFTTASLNSSAVTGSFGLVYEPMQKFNLSLNASTGFRSPNVDDMGKVFDSEPGAVVVPNADLKAEYAYNIEGGVGKIFADVLKVDVSAYYTLLDQALVRRDFNLNGADSIIYDGELSQVQAIQNAANAYVYGFHGGFELKLGNGFVLSSKVNFQYGEEVLDDGSKEPLRHAAPWFGTSKLSYSASQIKLELSAIYSGEFSNEELAAEEQSKAYLYAIDNNGLPYSPGWYTLNFKANYQINDTWSVSGGVENMADNRYKTYSSGIVAPGRNFIMAIKSHF